MSAVPARRLATAGSLALALALTTPAAAFAAPGDASPGKGDRSEEAKPRQGSSKGSSGEARPAGASTGQERAADRREPAREGRPTNRRPASGAGSAASSDPGGNNGTVKIDGEAFDDGRGNEPHVGCVFQVDFYGFDAGDTASITFTGQAPTGGGLLHSETATVISDDAAGGGQDRDATLTYSVEEQLSELLAIAPHPQQGWHVKLAVDVDSAPGGAKQKVFWIDCPQAVAVGGTTTDAATGDDTATAEGTSAPATVAAGGTPVEAFGPDSAVLGAHAEAAVAGTTLAAAERADALALGAANATTVSARGSRLPSMLAFTGVEGLAALLAFGLTAVGLGAAAHRLGRRRAAGEVG